MKLFTTVELAKSLKLTRQAVHNKIKKGKLKAAKIAGRWLITKREAAKWIKESKPKIQ